MWPNSPYAVPVSSFQRPVPLVLVDPCDDPAITVRINRQWVPYVLGALKQLVLQTTWDTNDPEALWLVQQRAMALLSCVVTAFNEPGCDCGCHKYTLSTDFITWEPNNPYLTPNLVPTGYRFPPWYVVGSTIPFTGLQEGDVITDLLHGPIVEPVSSGFPRFRTHVTGTGTVEVTFVRFPTAGIALITVDDNPATAVWVDLHISLASGIGSAFAEMIVPIEITTGGDHHIDISMIYSITEEPPFVHFGGGIRQIALCGFGETPSTAPITVIEDDYQMAICEQLRYQDGKLQGLCCGQWVDIDGQDSGSVAPGVSQPTDVPRPAVGDSACFTVLLQANSQWLLPFAVNNGDQITISEVKGAWWDGAVGPWYCPDGTPYVLGQCIGSQGHVSGDPDATDYHMQVIAKIGSVYYPASGGTFTVSGLTGPSQMILQANDSPLNDNAGSVTLKLCITSGGTPPDVPACYGYDFTLTDGGWGPYNEASCDEAIYTPGVGFGHGACREEYVAIWLHGFAPSHITKVTVNLDTPMTGSTKRVELITNVGLGDRQVFDNLPVTGTTTEFDIDVTGVVNFYVLLSNTDSTPSDVNPSSIVSVIIEGSSPLPFGPSNC